MGTQRKDTVEQGWTSYILTCFKFQVLFSGQHKHWNVVAYVLHVLTPRVTMTCNYSGRILMYWLWHFEYDMCINICTGWEHWGTNEHLCSGLCKFQHGLAKLWVWATPSCFQLGPNELAYDDNVLRRHITCRGKGHCQKGVCRHCQERHACIRESIRPVLVFYHADDSKNLYTRNWTYLDLRVCYCEFLMLNVANR